MDLFVALHMHASSRRAAAAPRSSAAGPGCQRPRSAWAMTSHDASSSSTLDLRDLSPHLWTALRCSRRGATLSLSSAEMQPPWKHPAATLPTVACTQPPPLFISPLAAPPLYTLSSLLLSDRLFSVGLSFSFCLPSFPFPSLDVPLLLSLVSVRLDQPALLARVTLC